MLSTRQIIPRYILSGVCSTLVYYLIFQGLLMLGCCSLYLATSIAYFAGVFVNFTMHRSITFQAADQPISHGLFRYMVVLLANYGITIVIMYFMTAHYQTSPQLAWLVAMTVTTVFGFIIGRLWVFNIKQV